MGTNQSNTVYEDRTSARVGQIEIDVRREYDESNRACREEIDALIEKICNYKLGNILGEHNFNSPVFADMKSHPFRIAIIGITGAGKSCLINTMHIALKKGEKCELIAAQQDIAEEGTIRIESHLMQFSKHESFKVLDTRGIHRFSDADLGALRKVFYGIYRSGEEMNQQTADSDEDIKKTEIIPNRLHGVVFVVSGEDPNLFNATYRERFKKTREMLKREGLAPVAVITKSDKLEDDRLKEAVTELAAAIGSSEDATFTISNYTMLSTFECNLEAEKTALTILWKALERAEIYVKNILAGENYSQEQSITEFVEAFVIKYNLFSREEAILQIFRENDIGTLEILRGTWSSIQQQFHPPALATKIKRELDESSS